MNICSGITVLLTLTVFQNIVTETLPQVSNTIPVLGTHNAILTHTLQKVIYEVSEISDGADIREF